MNLNINPLVLATDIPKLDLSRNIENKENLEKLINETNINRFANLKELFENIFQSIENNLKYFFLMIDYLFNFLRNPNDTTLRKIVIHNLFSKLCQIKYTNFELFKFLHSLQVFLKSSFSTLLITIPPNISNQIKKVLIQSSDLVIKIQEIFGLDILLFSIIIIGLIR
jgi:hypothetical protein